MFGRVLARKMAREMAGKNPHAITLACQCLASVEMMPVLESYAFESRLARQLGESDAAQSLMRSFLAHQAR